MSNRVVPEPAEDVEPLTLGEKATWAVYLPKALIDEVKRAAKEDRFSSASAYTETLLIYALRQRERERIADRESRRKK